MYILASQLINLPIMSLQTGQPVASVKQPVVSMTKLEVMALTCQANRQQGVILMRDIRQFAADCIIIDSFEDIEDPNEIVRLREIVARDFNPIGRQVVNEGGQKLGKVEDYTINLKTNMLQKLYVHQSLMKSLLFNNLVVDRTQIIDITPHQFTVRDATVTEKSLAPTLPAVPE